MSGRRSPIEAPASPGRATVQDGGLFASMSALLFGYDFFISYRNRDATTYATTLHNRLTDAGFACFLDQLHYEAGHNLPHMQSSALRRSTKLILVLSPGAHDPLESKTDWVLAEVLEFKFLHRKRAGHRTIIPIGSLNTFCLESYPHSRLLAEIPNPSRGDICIFDDGVERDLEPADLTIAKLSRDFDQLRRRTLQRRLLASLCIVLLTALAWTGIAVYRQSEARTLARLADAYAQLANPAGDHVTARTTLASMGKCTNVADTWITAKAMGTLRTTRRASFHLDQRYLHVSSDGASALIICDNSDVGGNDDIPESEWPRTPACVVIDLNSGVELVRAMRSDPLGARLYANANVEFRSIDEVVIDAYLPPRDTAMHAGDEPSVSPDVEPPPRRVSVSLRSGKASDLLGVPIEGAGGSGEPGDSNAPTNELPSTSSTDEPGEEDAKRRIEALLDDRSLFRIDPELGIDREYGPYLREVATNVSPDGRTLVVGTYEGRLLVIDRGTGLPRGEERIASVLDVAFGASGTTAIVLDKDGLVEVDTSGWPFVELLAPLEGLPEEPARRIDSVALNDEGGVAVLSARHCVARTSRASEWLHWQLPESFEKAGDIDFLPEMQAIVAGSRTGALALIDTRQPGSPPTVVEEGSPGQESVAWLDSPRSMAFIVDSATLLGDASVLCIDLSQRPPVRRTVVVPLQLVDGSPADAERPVIHAIFGNEQEIAVANGSPLGDLDIGQLPERVSLFSMMDNTASHMEVARPSIVQLGPDAGEACDRIARFFASASISKLTALSSKGTLWRLPQPTEQSPVFDHELLDFRALYGKNEAIESRLDRVGSDVVFECRETQRGVAASLTVPLPPRWRTSIGRLSPSGRSLALVGEDGRITILRLLP